MLIFFTNHDFGENHTKNTHFLPGISFKTGYKKCKFVSCSPLPFNFADYKNCYNKSSYHDHCAKKGGKHGGHFPPVGAGTHLLPFSGEKNKSIKINHFWQIFKNSYAATEINFGSYKTKKKSTGIGFEMSRIICVFLNSLSSCSQVMIPEVR